MEKIKILFMTSRPLSWINTAYPFAVGYLISGGSFGWHFVVGTIFFLIPYNLLMYGVNDVFDYESDIKNERKGGVEGAVTERLHHPLILTSSFLLAIPFLLALILWSDPTSVLILIGVIFFVIAYSLRGLRFKEVPVLDSITSSIHFVGPLVYALSLNSSLSHFWPFVLAFFFWGAASQALGAIQDMVPDREGGIRSIATMFGAKYTVLFCLVLYSAAIAVLSFQGLGSLIVAGFGIIYVINVIPFIGIADDKSHLARQAWKRFLWINYLVGAVITILLIAGKVL